MCRFIAYLGQTTLLDNILIKPSNSLLAQSLHAKETDMPTNGDGFGVGWYQHHIDDSPGLFASISPAWNNRNLKHLAAKIDSDCFFSHVRAATAGGVTEYNCHPFYYQNIMCMHNGGIGNFKKIKRHIRRSLDDDLYDWIKGETDSEHLFALYLQNAKAHGNNMDITQMREVLTQTLQQILELVETHGDNAPSHLNVCITDGKQIVASRVTSDDIARSLHLGVGSEVHIIDESCHLKPINGTEKKCVIIASEKLNNDDSQWQDIAPNQIVSIDADFNVSMHAFNR